MSQENKNLHSSTCYRNIMKPGTFGGLQDMDFVLIIVVFIITNVIADGFASGPLKTLLPVITSGSAYLFCYFFKKNKSPCYLKFVIKYNFQQKKFYDLPKPEPSYDILLGDIKKKNKLMDDISDDTLQ